MIRRIRASEGMRIRRWLPTLLLFPILAGAWIGIKPFVNRERPVPEASAVPVAAQSERLLRLRILTVKPIRYIVQSAKAPDNAPDVVTARVRIENPGTTPIAYINHPELLSLEIRDAGGERVAEMRQPDYILMGYENVQILSRGASLELTLSSPLLKSLRKGQYSVAIVAPAPYPEHILKNIRQDFPSIDSVVAMNIDSGPALQLEID